MSAEHETMTRRPTLFAALSKAQGEIKAAAKDNKNPHFGSKYADLASVWEACRAALAKHGICVIQQPLTDDKRVGCVTILGHEGGDEMRSEPLWTTPKDMSPQSVGSCVTYLRRYQLSAMVGVAPDDDDGNAAQGHTPPKGNGPAAPAPKPARADKVTHDGRMATREQIDTLLDLRRQVGGLTVCTNDKPCPYPNKSRCGYHGQLAAFKDGDGNPVRDADKLASEQIDNLIGRYRAQIAKQGARAAEGADIGVIDLTAVRSELARKTQTDEEFSYAEQEVCAVFGVDKLAELTDKQQVSAAMALVMAFQTDAWDSMVAKVTGAAP